MSNKEKKKNNKNQKNNNKKGVKSRDKYGGKNYKFFEDIPVTDQ